MPKACHPRAMDVNPWLWFVIFTESQCDGIKEVRFSFCVPNTHHSSCPILPRVTTDFPGVRYPESAPKSSNTECHAFGLMPSLRDSYSFFCQPWTGVHGSKMPSLCDSNVVHCTCNESIRAVKSILANNTSHVFCPQKCNRRSHSFDFVFRFFNAEGMAS